MRYGIVGMVLGASILRATPGAACSPPQYSYSIDEFGPTTDDVELNAPLLLTIGQHANTPDTAQELDPVLELQAAGSDSKVLLRPTYLSGVSGVLSFVPQTPLEPSTTYQVSARLDAKVSEPSASVLASWQLTTGTKTRSPLELDGDFEVTFEEGEDAVFECESAVGMCGPSCVEVGKVTVTKARITLPAVRGGFANEYLTGSVSLSSAEAQGDGDALETEPVPGLRAGEPGELLLTLPLVDAAAYRPCFTFEVSDARHDKLRSAPFCSKQAFPEPSKQTDEPEPPVEDETDLPDDTVRPNEPPRDDMSDAELAANDDRASRGTSSGCSTSRGSHGLGSALGLLLGLAALTRRRPSRTAP